MQVAYLATSFSELYIDIETRGKTTNIVINIINLYHQITEPTNIENNDNWKNNTHKIGDFDQFTNL